MTLTDCRKLRNDPGRGMFRAGNTSFLIGTQRGSVDLFRNLNALLLLAVTHSLRSFFVTIDDINPSTQRR